MSFLFIAISSLFLLVIYILFPRTFKSQLDHIFKYLLGCHNLPIIRYHKDSAFCKTLLQSCPILKEKYTPPLWGYIGHLQTMWFGGRSSFLPPLNIKGKRQYVYVDDGSTVTYDIFEPSSKRRNEVILVLPGIGNSSESDYIQSFCKQANDIGYCVCVLNHMGSLKDHKLTGHRIFTYGGTGDITVMFNDLESKFDADTKFIGVGFSMGALVLVKFLGEQIHVQKRFLCAVSVSQGYCLYKVVQIYKVAWKEMRAVYFFAMTNRIIKIIKKDKDQLYTNHPVIKRKLSPTSNGVVTNSCISTSVKECVPVPYLSGDRDLNGFPIDNERILVPDDKMWSAKTFYQLDENYTRRVMGFDSYEDLLRFVACNEHFYKIPDLPILFLNAFDDPVVPKEIFELPIKYTEFNHNAMFVGTEHGGHLGFFEGGWIVSNETRWCDRLIFQYIHGCNNTSSPSSS